MVGEPAIPGVVGQAIAVYGHIHQSFVRRLAGLTVINTGSVSQSFDGDPPRFVLAP